MESPRKNPSRGALQALVLDWAGTTIDFGCIAPVAGFLAVLRNKGIEIDPKQVRQFMGRSKRDHIRAMLDLDNVSRQWKKKYGALPGPTDVESLYVGFMEVQEEFLRASAQLIPGTVEAIRQCRNRGLKIGTSTGYFREQMDILAPLAAEQGYTPDTIVCADDIPAGRPAPWEIIENAKLLGGLPANRIVKVDDTVVGIEAGINAGAWTVGIYATGNLVGLSKNELFSLPENERLQLLECARCALEQAGANLCIATIADLPAALDELEQRIAQNEI